MSEELNPTEENPLTDSADSSPAKEEGDKVATAFPKRSRSVLSDPERAQKSLTLASKTPIWIDAVTSVGVVGVLVANADQWSIWARIFFIILLVLGMIGQTRFSSSVAIRSDWFVGIGIAGAVVGFGIGIVLVPRLIRVYTSYWWLLAVFVVFAVIGTFIFRGIRWLALSWAQQKELNREALAKSSQEKTLSPQQLEEMEAEAESVDQFTTQVVDEYEKAEADKAETASAQDEADEKPKDEAGEADVKDESASQAESGEAL